MTEILREIIGSWTFWLGLIVFWPAFTGIFLGLVLLKDAIWPDEPPTSEQLAYDEKVYYFADKNMLELSEMSVKEFEEWKVWYLRESSILHAKLLKEGRLIVSQYDEGPKHIVEWEKEGDLDNPKYRE